MASGFRLQISDAAHVITDIRRRRFIEMPDKEINAISVCHVVTGRSMAFVMNIDRGAIVGLMPSAYFGTALPSRLVGSLVGNQQADDGRQISLPTTS